MTDEEPTHKHWTLPSWAIVALGVLATGGALIWAGGLHDPVDGTPLLDDTVAKILIVLLGTAGTFLGLLVQRTSEVRHQVKNSHGTNLRDDVDDVRRELTVVREIAEHSVRANRDTSEDVKQLREDVQAGRTETGEVRADVRGLRRDIGRLTDIITSKES
ncbi:hypothetical protein [Microbacterium xylanilyticum]